MALLAGCTSTPSGGVSSSTDASAGAFPVTVTGKLGSATIQAKPTRVVALSWTDGDVALGMGVVPVGMGAVPTSESGFDPWTEQVLGSSQRPALLDMSKDTPLEAIAALRPDVILATKFYGLDDSYAELSKIAPVVGYVNGPNADTWQDTTTMIGKGLGVPDAAAKSVTDTEAAIRQAAAANPGFAGRTFSLLVTPRQDGVYTVNSTDDVSSALLSQLGLRLSPTVTGLPSSEIPGRSNISYEQIGLVSADVVFATGSPGSLKILDTTPGFTMLPVVAAGGYVPLEPALAQSIAFPSPISIRWSMENLPPKIAAALHL
ncbi:MAG: hypothetical protein ABS81_08365 [Pseudonocardia sp. SCN 72-86]|nr:MAG: hypothetical protein ABS81_08365 [Pseudonocardia sp. SCN 72-86]